MNYNKDLLKLKTNSKLQIILGFTLLALAIAWYPIQLHDKDNVSIFDWFFVIIFSLNGIIQVTTGFGVPPRRLLGKAYIVVNDQEIIYKPYVLKPERKASWKNIESITYQTGRIDAYDANGKCLSIVQPGCFDFPTLQEVKAAIISISNEKNIPFADSTND
jgi:antitoxin component YwqK of YwqJK toxin-antitoxin module